MNYYVVAISYPRTAKRPAEVQAVVEPEMTRSNVIDRITSGEYQRDRIAFIHFIHDGVCEVVTDELISAASLPEENIREVDSQSIRFDHARDLRKHEVVR